MLVSGLGLEAWEVGIRKFYWEVRLEKGVELETRLEKKKIRERRFRESKLEKGVDLGTRLEEKLEKED